MAASAEKSSKSTLVRGVTKKVFRTRELVLQNLGKVDKTEDDLFNEFVSNFSKQQMVSAKLQKYLNNYIQAERAAVFSANALRDVMTEVYEDSWPGSVDLGKCMEESKAISSEFLRELDRTAAGLLSHQAQFQDVRAKIERRKRKLVDYDSLRHTAEQMRQGRKKDDSKLMRAEEKSSDARRMYESLNQELLELLPALWDSRVVTYGSTFQSLFASKSNYHLELNRLNSALSEVIDGLFAERGKEFVHPILPPPIYAVISRAGSVSNPRTPIGSSRASSVSHSFRAKAPSGGVGGISTDSAVQSGSLSMVSGDHQQQPLQLNYWSQRLAASPAGLSSSNPALTGSHDSLQSKSSMGDTYQDLRESKAHSPKQAPSDAALDLHQDDGFESDGRESPVVGSSTATSPSHACRVSKVLYQVVATHPYVKEDDDELTFDATDVINVLPFEEEDPDEGWLFGFIDSKPDSKGLFPANFTRKIS